MPSKATNTARQHTLPKDPPKKKLKPQSSLNRKQTNPQTQRGKEHELHRYLSKLEKLKRTASRKRMAG